jgi:hypothetical protein
MFVIGRVVRRHGDRKSRKIAAVLARGERLAFHYCHLVLVLMSAAFVHDVVDSRSGAEIARFELIHKVFHNNVPYRAVLAFATYD